MLGNHLDPNRKIAHITTVDMSLRYLLLDQLVNLQDTGYEVVGISTPGENVEAIEAAGIRHIAVPMTRRFNPLADAISLWRLYRVMREENFALVHTHTPKPGLLGQLAAWLAGVPIIVNTIHGYYFHEYMAPYWKWFYRLLEKSSARLSSLVFFVNQEDMDTAVREGICPPSKMRRLGPGGIGIDIRRFDPNSVTESERQALLSELEIAESAQVVGFVGRLVREKGSLNC